MTRSNRGRKKEFFQYDFYGEMYAEGAKRVGKYGFPQLTKQTFVPTQNVRPFNYLLSMDNPSEYWLHCFCDDYQFERLWKNFYYYLPFIARFGGFISTDYSLYRDYDDSILVWNCYRNRCIAYAAQRTGKPFVPTAGFGPERTWDWCYDGLPSDSSVAITTNGVLDDAEARRLFVGGIEALYYTKHPANLIICGNYPAWLDKKYPDMNIIGIPSFSQQWKGRRCA